jgi:hypothetical protein
MDGILDMGFIDGTEGMIFMLWMELGRLPKKEKGGFTEKMRQTRRFNGMHTSV